MKKVVISAVCLALAAFATTANAASYSYSSVSTSVSGGGSASAVVNSIVGGTNSHSEVWIDGHLVENENSPAAQTVAPTLRETNRDLIERVRAQGTNTAPSVHTSNEVYVQQNVQNVNGSTTAQVRVYRKENGKVVEDRTIPLSPQTAGKPYLYRSTINNGNSSSDVEVRTILASSSRAVVIRDLADTTWLPWWLHVPFFSSRGPGVESTTTLEDRLLLSYDERRVPFDNLLDRIFNMFR